MRALAARAALLALALGATGCAAILNGASDKVSAKSPTPGARVYVDGFDATDAPVTVPNDRPHVLLVRAPGHLDAVRELDPVVKPVPIVLDVLLTVPTLAIAPLTDLSLGWWSDLDIPEEPIALQPTTLTARARPTYQVGDHAIASVAGNATPPPAAPPPPPPPPPAVEPPPGPSAAKPAGKGTKPPALPGPTSPAPKK